MKSRLLKLSAAFLLVILLNFLIAWAVLIPAPNAAIPRPLDDFRAPTHGAAFTPLHSCREAALAFIALSHAASNPALSIGLVA